MKIYKYPVPPGSRFAIEMPEGSQLLSLQMQNGEPMIWAAVTDKAPIKYMFQRLGTGHEFDRDILVHHVGTYQDGGFVWHVFSDAGVT